MKRALLIVSLLLALVVSAGANNFRGPAGPTGPEGPRGPKGEQGDPGRDGRDGIDGINGKDGIDGINGKDGRHGINTLPDWAAMSVAAGGIPHSNAPISLGFGLGHAADKSAVAFGIRLRLNEHVNLDLNGMTTGKKYGGSVGVAFSLMWGSRNGGIHQWKPSSRN